MGKINANEGNMKGAYSKAYLMACEQLYKMAPEEITRCTGADYDRQGDSLSFEYMGGVYKVDCGNGKVFSPEGDSVEDTVLKTLFLHYLTNGKSLLIRGRQVAFSEIPGGGAMYDSSYKKRVILPLVKRFGGDPDALLEASRRFNGEKACYGDLSVTINVFPMVPVTYVVWKGDDEFSPSATILFDESISLSLPVEDIVIMTSFATYTLIKEAGSVKG